MAVDFLHFFNPKRPSPELEAFRSKLRAKGRNHFIFYTWVLTWAGSVFVLSTLWSWHAKYGWHRPPRADLFSNSLDIAFNLVLWPTAGYFLGARMWRKIGLDDSTNGQPRPNSTMDAILGKRNSTTSP
jgi:hypothetical protein